MGLKKGGSFLIELLQTVLLNLGNPIHVVQSPRTEYVVNTSSEIFQNFFKSHSYFYIPFHPDR